METFAVPINLQDESGVIHGVSTDNITWALNTIDYAHHEIHAGSSYHAGSYTASVATDATTNIYIKTPATAPYCHMFAEWESGGAAVFSIYEAPTITANSGTNGQVIYNRNRNSTGASGCLDNATVPVAAKYGINVTKTGNGTILMIDYSGVGKTASGFGRNESEWILDAGAAYLFEVKAIGNNIPLNILLDWYEHTNK